MKVEIRTTILPPLVLDLAGDEPPGLLVQLVKPEIRALDGGGGELARYQPAGAPGEWSPVLAYILAVVIVVGVATIGTALVLAVQEVTK